MEHPISDLYIDSVWANISVTSSKARKRSNFLIIMTKKIWSPFYSACVCCFGLTEDNSDREASPDSQQSVVVDKVIDRQLRTKSMECVRRAYHL